MGRPLPAGLDLALDDLRVEPALVRLVRDQLGVGTRVRAVTAQIVKRRVVRYTVELRGSGALHLIGKVYESRAAGELGLAALGWLWQQGFPAAAPARVTVPRVLGYLPELSLLVMEEAGGASLQRMLKSGAAEEGHLRLFAEALVKLHRFTSAFKVPSTLEDHLERRCAGQCGPLVQAFPDLAEPIMRILAAAQHATPAASTLIHGDYHPGQVHLDGERLWLVDLDPLDQGDPAYDVAMAVVTLKRLAGRAGGAEAARALRAAFLGAYFERMSPVLAARVPLQAALIYLKRACKRFRWQDEDGWQASVRRQVRLGEACLAWLRDSRPPRRPAEAVELCERCPADLPAGASPAGGP